MNTGRIRTMRILAAAGLLAALAATGCQNEFGHADYAATAQRKLAFDAPLEPGNLVVIENENGAVRVRGRDAPGVRVEAELTVGAPTAELARQLVEEVDIRLERSAGQLHIELRRPERTFKYGVAVDYRVHVPRVSELDLTTLNGDLAVHDIRGGVYGRTRNGRVDAGGIAGVVSLETHNGDVDIEDIDGDLTAHTHNGKVDLEKVGGPDRTVQAKTFNGDIEAEDARGKVTLQTHNGAVDVEGARGQLDLETQTDDIVAEDVHGDLSAVTAQGDIKVLYADDAAPVCRVHLETRAGDVTFEAPPGFDAEVDARTGQGEIETGWPLPLRRQGGSQEVRGLLRNGRGKLHVETDQGKIKLK